MAIQVNLWCFLHVSLGFGTKYTWIFIIKIFAINLPSSYISYLFTIAFLGVHTFFTA